MKSTRSRAVSCSTDADYDRTSSITILSLSLFVFLRFETQATQLRIHKKRHLTSAGTSVTETQPKETNQAMLSSLFPPAHNESQGNQPQLSLPTCTQRKSGKPTFQLWPKTLERRSSPFSPSHCLSETNMKEKNYPLNSEGQVVRFLPFHKRTRSEAEPAAPPFNFMQLLAQHVQGNMAAQSYLCHLPVL